MIVHISVQIGCPYFFQIDISVQNDCWYLCSNSMFIYSFNLIDDIFVQIDCWHFCSKLSVDICVQMDCWFFCSKLIVDFSAQIDS